MAQDISFDIVARDKASSTFSRIAKSSEATESRLKKFGRTTAALAGIAGGAAIGAGLISFLKSSNAEARESQKVGALTTQVIKTTGGAAKVTADQVGDLSTAISNKVGVDDEAVQSGANLLLTFKNVRNEVGKGNQIFDRATAAAVDLSASGFGNLSGTSKQLGKALNDPLKGITALSRAGVTFTDQQKKQIKTLVESGNILRAQKIILREVESQVGGSAAAQATAGDKAAVSIANLKEQIGTALLPVVDDLATLTSDKLVPSISEFVTGMQDGTGAGGDVAAVLEDVADIGKGVLSFFQSIPEPVKKYGAAVAIAAFATSRLSNGLGGIGGRLTVFSTSIRDAETRTAKLTTGLRGLGSGLTNVAGAGGMVLLADSADEAGTSMGALKAAAGGALTGAALGAFGGPVGAGIGAGIGAIAGASISLAQNTSGAGEAAKIAIPSFQEYGSTLRGVEAATTGATRALVLQRLEQSGLLKATGELGLSERQAVNAVLGVGNARKILAQNLRTNTTLTNAQKEALVKETGAVQRSRLQTLQHNVAIADTKEKLRVARKALQDYQNTPTPAKTITVKTEDAKLRLGALRTTLLALTDTAWAVRVNVKTGKNNVSKDVLDPTGSLDRRAGDAGRSVGTNYATGVIAGITGKQMTVGRALERLGTLASRVTSKLADLRATRAEFLSTFQSDSIFGADLQTTGKSIGGLLSFQSQQAQKAAQIAADVQAVTSMGLSGSLIKQLQSQGSAGADQLHILAGGSVEQIRQFNALNAQTQASLQAAGMTAGNAGRGGNINADIAQAKRDEALVNRLIRALDRRDDELVIMIDSEAVIRAVKRRNKRKGVPSAGL